MPRHAKHGFADERDFAAIAFGSHNEIGVYIVVAQAQIAFGEIDIDARLADHADGPTVAIVLCVSADLPTEQPVVSADRQCAV